MKRFVKILVDKPWLGYSLIALLFGGIFATLTPPMLGIDEFYHFNRAYQISNGGFRSDTVNGKIGGVVPTAVIDYQKEIIDARYEGRFLENKTWASYTKEAYRISMNGPREMAHYAGAAAYSPLTYGPAALIMFFSNQLDASFGLTVTLARIAMTVVFVGIVAYAVYVLRSYKIKWLVIAIALWPKVVFQAATLSADTLSVALALLLFALYVKAFTEKKLDRSEQIALLLASISLPFIKFNYIFLSLITLFLPVRLLHNIGIKVSFYQLQLRIAVGLTILIGTFGWLYVVKDYADKNNSGNTTSVVQENVDPSIIGKLNFLLNRPIDAVLLLPRTMIENGKQETSDFLTRMPSSIGFNFTRLPTLVVLLAWGLVFAMLLYARNELIRIRWFVILSTVMGIMSSVGIFMVLYLAWTAAGSVEVTGMQGRYFLPVLPYVLTCIALLLPIRFSFTRSNAPSILVYGTSFVCLSLAVFYYLGQTYTII